MAESTIRQEDPWTPLTSVQTSALHKELMLGFAVNLLKNIVNDGYIWEDWEEKGKYSVHATFYN